MGKEYGQLGDIRLDDKQKRELVRAIRKVLTPAGCPSPSLLQVGPIVDTKSFIGRSLMGDFQCFDTEPDYNILTGADLGKNYCHPVFYKTTTFCPGSPTLRGCDLNSVCVTCQPRHWGAEQERRNIHTDEVTRSRRQLTGKNINFG